MVFFFSFLLLLNHKPLVEQELLTLPGHLRSPPSFSGVSIALSLGFCIVFCTLLLVHCPFSFGNFVVCPSSIYGFWLSFWYLQILLLNISRRFWRYQRGIQNPYIGEEQTTHGKKSKKDKQRSTKQRHKTKDRITRTALKTGDELRCSGRVGS